MKLSVTDPNFSIVVPGDCNAKCAFCFWRNEQQLSQAVYLAKLEETLAQLPADFTQCSITGGEPTLNPYLADILQIARKRFNKIVLSTNGAMLGTNLIDMVDHVNISRHHYDDSKNCKIFGTSSMISGFIIRRRAYYAEHKGVDITLNCVLPPHFNDSDFIFEYIDFAKKVNVHKVTFRKEHSDLLDLLVESSLDSKILSDSSCPVCRIKTRYINGMMTSWKYSVKEPSDIMDGVYELIFQPDGRLTSDWAGKKVQTLKPLIPIVKKDLVHVKDLPQKETCEMPSRCGLKVIPSSRCGSSGCN